MDSVGLNLIKTAALGRCFELGMLYDCRKDALIPGIRLWNNEELKKNISSRNHINTRFNLTASDSIKDKSELLNIGGELKLSLLSGLISVSGAGKYLNDTKTSFKQERLTLLYHSTSRFEELIINHLPSIKNIPDDENNIATHVVTGIKYGADACFIFDRKISVDEDKTTVEGELKVALEKLKGVISLDGNVNLSMNDSQKNAVKNFTCTFYGDFQLPSNPTSFEGAMKVFADLPKLGKNKGLAVPLTVWLYPLDKLHSRASKLHKNISMDLIMRIESVVESLNTAEMKCSDFLEDSPAQTFAAFHDKIQQMKKNCDTYKLRLIKQLGSLLPNIRGDTMKETALNELLLENDKSPFRGSDLTEWLEERERESEIIKSVLGRLKAYDAQIVDNIDAVWMGLDVGNLLCYTFTSLDCLDVLLFKQAYYLSPSAIGETDQKIPDLKQKSWLTPEIKKCMKRNLKILKNFIHLKDSKTAKFIVSSKEIKNHPGSCILLYESERDEAVCFTPPSKPACPIIEEVKGQKVVLKVVPPSCPATVELRLLYKVKHDTVWTSEHVLKDQNTVTLTDLREETEYEIKCAAVGKLNYTVDSDAICVTTEKSTWNRTVKGDVRIVLLGKTGVGKSAAGNTILRREAFKSILTSRSFKEISEFNRRWITVIDTPGLYDSGADNVDVRKEIVMSISMAAPGPHVFLLVIQLGRFTQEEKDIVKIIHETFGDKSRMYTMVLFTRGDKLRGRRIQDFIEDDESLKSLIQQCDHRYHVFNNNETEDLSQVSELLEKIDCMVTENGGSFYTNNMFQLVDKNINERQKMIIKEKQAVIKRREEELRAKYETEIHHMKKEKQRQRQEMQIELRKSEEEFKKRNEEIKKETDVNLQKKMKRKLEENQREYEEENKRKEKSLGEQEQDFIKRMEEKHEKDKQNLQERIQRETREQAEHEYNKKLDRRVAKALKEAEEKHETEKAKALKEAEKRHQEKVDEVLQDSEKKHKEEKAKAEAQVSYRSKRASDWSYYVPFFGGAAGSLVGTLEDIVY